MNRAQGLTRHLSPMGAWAFAIGTSVGWGSLVVTANTYLAQAGPAGSVLGLALVITSLIGNTSALSRLLYAMAKDRLLPEALSGVNDRGVPARAVMAVAAVSCLVPLLGRTATGWIVDVTTIGATLVYGFVSGAAAHLARKMKDRREMWVGRAGLGLMVVFGAYLLVSNLVSRGTIARETYFLFAVWSVLGFWYFRRILRQDKEKRFGLSVVVWAATNSW
ncbi:MAG: amino acid permease [Clostridia bacterium]|nr:amino acid permease [Clostridia bacterium]